MQTLSRLFSLRAVLAVALAWLVCLTVTPRFSDPDMWWHLKVGQIIWTTHSIPSTDTFSYTAQGHFWMAHEWLSQLSIYAAYHLGGYTGLMLWLAVFTSLLFVLVYALCYRASGSAGIALSGALFALFFGTISLAIRPLIIGNIFLVTELLLLEASARDRRILWLLPPLFALWVNCHGSFFFGMGVLGVYWICSMINMKRGLLMSEPWDRERRRQLGIVMVFCAVALLVNPVGPRLVFYPLDTLFVQVTSLNIIEEWHQPDLSRVRGIALIFSMIGLFFLAISRGRELRLRDFLLAAVTFVLAIEHQRLMFLYGIMLAPVFSRMLSPAAPKPRQAEHPFANALLIASFIFGIVTTFPPAAALQRQIAKKNPVAAVDYIRQKKLPGPMLNDYGFGGYLIWALPEHKVFIDGRADIFDWTGIFREYGQWKSLAEDPRLLPDKYHVRLCILRAHDPMALVMPYLPGWHRAYADDVAAVFTR